MKKFIFLFLTYFCFEGLALAHPFEEFHGTWQGKGTHQFLKQTADCDFKLTVEKQCKLNPCESNPIIQIVQENTECVPRDVSQPAYTYPHSIWARFYIDGVNVVDAQSKEVVGRYEEGTVAFDYLLRNDNARFWMLLRSDGSCEFHETAVFQPWETAVNVYSASLQHIK